MLLLGFVGLGLCWLRGCFGLRLFAVYACDTFVCVRCGCLWARCWCIDLDVGLRVSGL